MRSSRTVRIALVLGGAALALPTPIDAAASAPASAVVLTDHGAVRGTVGADARLFQGIPYAAPPVGALRWQAPQPAAAWTGVRDATRPASPCPQVPVAVLPGASNRTGSSNEDCLYLNVWTPPNAGARGLPVFVWLHGGSNIFGAGSDYDATPFARRDVVVVTINYRLGALGFLAHPALSAEAADQTSGDYALADQQAALRWVQRNIRGFGGDPRRVTLGGESAGATDTCAHLASPTAAGLFVRAISESGSCLSGGSTSPPTLAAATTAGQGFAARVGCPGAATAACLRAVPVPALLAAEGTTGWGPTLGPAVLPISPAAAWATGRAHRMPVLNGTNHDEYRFFTSVQIDFVSGPLTAASYPARIQADFPGIAAQVLAEYPAAAYATPNIAYATVRTDQLFSCRARADNLLYSGHEPVYGYEFNDPDAPPFITDPALPQAAFHAAELAYLFGGATLTAAQQRLADTMSGYWTRFIATGNPNGRHLPAWPRYVPAGGSADRIQLLAPTSVRPVGTFAADHRCQFWQRTTGLPA
ncbi:MAG TPA: carboxylesterase family protein [Mycobacteriales bacterium]|nr:carboxylesterase family protein [Mycobacteriales bacterium]